MSRRAGRMDIEAEKKRSEAGRVTRRCREKRQKAVKGSVIRVLPFCDPPGAHGESGG